MLCSGVISVVSVVSNFSRAVVKTFEFGRSNLDQVRVFVYNICEIKIKIINNN